jgi:hypothetical protein
MTDERRPAINRVRTAGDAHSAGPARVGARRLTLATIPISIGFWAWMSLLAPAPLDAPTAERTPRATTAPAATTTPRVRVGVRVGVIGLSESTKSPCPADGAKLPPGCRRDTRIGKPYAVQLPTDDPTQP